MTEGRSGSRKASATARANNASRPMMLKRAGELRTDAVSATAEGFSCV
jgi:hypothetical protein